MATASPSPQMASLGIASLTSIPQPPPPLFKPLLSIWISSSPASEFPTTRNSKSGTLNFDPDQESASFTVDFKGNPAAHGPRVFEVILSSPTGGATLDEDRRTSVIISDDIESSTLTTDPTTLTPTLVHGASAYRQTLRAWNLNGFGRRNIVATSTTPWITIEKIEQGDAITPVLISLKYDISQLPIGRHIGSIAVDQTTAPASSLQVPVLLTIGYPGTAVQANALSTNIDIPVDGPIPCQGPASSYPVHMPAPPSPHRVGAVFLGLDSLTHSDPADLDIVLVTPDGKSSLLISDTATSSSTVTLPSLIGDAFLQSIPVRASDGLSGPRKPTNLSGEDPDLMPSPAPQTPGRLLADLSGGPVAGEWKLFINDDTEGNFGSFHKISLVSKLRR